MPAPIYAEAPVVTKTAGVGLFPVPGLPDWLYLAAKDSNGTIIEHAATMKWDGVTWSMQRHPLATSQYFALGGDGLLVVT